jgi:hypothetical protein
MFYDDRAAYLATEIQLSVAGRLPTDPARFKSNYTSFAVGALVAVCRPRR